MRVSVGQASLSVLLVSLFGGCDYSGDWLFTDAETAIETIRHITGEDGEPIVPAVISSMEDIGPATIYAEIGAPVDANLGGTTFEFVGTGGDVCLWMDQETVSWNPAVARIPSVSGPEYAYADNVFDDGDIDIYGGLSVYYTGSPGEEIGDFVVEYEDSLGNKVPVVLSECNMRGGGDYGLGAHSGRGGAEYCTMTATDPGITYTVLLQTFAAPLDDDRMSYGVLLAEGRCDALRTMVGGGLRGDECVIRGESIVPQGNDIGPWYGYDASRSWPGVEAVEEVFCDVSGQQDAGIVRYCEAEWDAKNTSEGDGGEDTDGIPCEWNEITKAENRCFCGDLTDMPEGGAF
jgi:hypothetical protein